MRSPGILLVLLAASVGAPVARAENAPAPCNTLTDPNNAPSTDPRVDHILIGGGKVTVLVPPAYRTGTSSYPVLYLFHGAFGDEDSFTAQTDLISFTDGLPDAAQAIVVMVDQGHLDAGADWADGTQPQETYFIQTVVPAIDASYRTIAQRAYRAAAGFSGGGLDALAYASRHPDLFVAAGAFSGFVDPLTPRGVAITTAFIEADNLTCGTTHPSPFGIWGDPTLHPMGWEGHDPTYLAPNTRGLSLYIASGNGVSCPTDPQPSSVEAGMVEENTVYEMSQHLDAALNDAGIAHVTDFYGCGSHIYPYVNRDLHVFWPQMIAAFGTPAPSSFDYRTADRAASVWGWTLRADPSRAPEFLDVRGASANGVVVTGSGATTLTTATLFRPRQRVLVSGATSLPVLVEADLLGQLTFAVDLGAPHTLEEGTAAELATAALNPGYFVTRSVNFLPFPRQND